MTGLAFADAPDRTYGALALDGESWVVSDLEPHVAIRFKALFPSVPKSSRGPFKLPREPVTAVDLEWFCGRYPLRMDGPDLAALTAARTAFGHMQAEMGRILSPDYQPPNYAGLRPGQEVRGHQARAAEVVARMGGLLVGDEVGEGKTYTGGACMLIPGALPATVVCPPHLRGQWHDKIEAFTTLTTHVIRVTRPYAIPPADVRIFSYTQLQGWADYLEVIGTGLAVFDEIHELRGGTTTEKGAAAKRLADAARFKLGLTATPIFNYGADIWRVMQFIRPDVLGDYEDFAREWTDHGNVVKQPQALGSYLRDQFAMVRKLADGPKPNIIVQEIGHDARELEAVEDLAHSLAVTATTATFTERGEASRQLDLLLRQATGVAKAKAVAAYVRLIVEAGEPVILWGWHREVYDIWNEALADLKPAMFTGSETPRQKDEQKRRFLSGETDVFIMSLRSGAGLDGLQARASTGVFGELDWSPQMHHQCIGRMNREGQRCWPDPVTAIYLVADDGSDPPMQEVLGLKASQAHAIVDPTLGVQTTFSDAGRLSALVQKYLAKRPRGEAA